MSGRNIIVFSQFRDLVSQLQLALQLGKLVSFDHLGKSSTHGLSPL